MSLIMPHCQDEAHVSTSQSSNDSFCNYHIDAIVYNVLSSFEQTSLGTCMVQLTSERQNPFACSQALDYKQ